jgi:hypothetical protein
MLYFYFHLYQSYSVTLYLKMFLKSKSLFNSQKNHLKYTFKEQSRNFLKKYVWPVWKNVESKSRPNENGIGYCQKPIQQFSSFIFTVITRFIVLARQFRKVSEIILALLYFWFSPELWRYCIPKGDFFLCLKTGKFCLISRNTHFLSFLFIVGYSLLTYSQLLFYLYFSDCDANVFAAKVFTAMVVLVLLIDVFAELVLLVPHIRQWWWHFRCNF